MAESAGGEGVRSGVGKAGFEDGSVRRNIAAELWAERPDQLFFL